MNKELIKQYKAEFDYWLKDGELLFRPTNKQIWFNTTLSPIDWEIDGVYIIDDEYVEFRKALAEGKTVQRFYVNNTLQLTEWVDSNATDMLNYKVNELRIKPEEPKFKVGDWVVMTDSKGTITTQVEPHSNLSENIYTTPWKHWQPKVEEWCVFKERGVKHFIIDKFVETETFQKDGVCTQCDRHWAEFSETWFHEVYPIELIQTLKD